MDNILHLTYASEDNYHLHRLLTSASYWGIQVQVLGMNEPWKGFLQKPEAVCRLLEDVPGDRVILFLDAYDTIYLQPSPVIERKFREFERPVVFSADLCFHAPGNESIAGTYPPSPSLYRYLNSGCFIGYAAPLAHILTRILESPETDDDQSLLSRYFVEHPDEIALDYPTELFVNTGNRPYDEDFLIGPGGLKNTLTGTWPCILHTPGKYYGVLEFYSSQLPFYGNVRWSRLGPRAIGQIVSGCFNLKAYRALKRWGWVKNEQDFSHFLTRVCRRP